MVHIKVKNGLDIPISGKPSGSVKTLTPSGQSTPGVSLIALPLRGFEDIKFRLLVKPGDVVKIGQPLAEDKSSPGRMFVSPAAGAIKDIRRGLKRVLQEIIIEPDAKEEHIQYPLLNSTTASKEEIRQRLLEGGAFAHIRSRPFGRLADPHKLPRSIFVKAVETAPFVPPAEMQVAGHEKEFQAGLAALSKLTDGMVHLVYKMGTNTRAFTEAAGAQIQRHTVEGPHPAANHSVHIQAIDPIRSSEDNIWTLSALDVVMIGELLLNGRFFIDRIISIAGPGVLSDRIGYFKTRLGVAISSLIAGRIGKGPMRLISGDPLMGFKVANEDFLEYGHTAFCVIPENTHREFLHFFGAGTDKYTFSRAYLSGHFDNSDREYPFTTNQHGEHRAFIDSTLYDKVMPLKVPTMLLVKAVMAEDFELADTLGLLEVESEDFALPAFVCPSKMEMTEIIKKGLKQYAQEVLS